MSIKNACRSIINIQIGKNHFLVVVFWLVSHLLILEQVTGSYKKCKIEPEKKTSLKKIHKPLIDKRTCVNGKSFTYIDVFLDIHVYIKTKVLIFIRMYFRERPFIRLKTELLYTFSKVLVSLPDFFFKTPKPFFSNNRMKTI